MGMTQWMKQFVKSLMDAAQKQAQRGAAQERARQDAGDEVLAAFRGFEAIPAQEKATYMPRNG